MSGKIDQNEPSRDVSSGDRTEHGLSFSDVQEGTPQPRQKSSGLAQVPASSDVVPPMHRDAPVNLTTAPQPSQERSVATEHSPVSFGQKDPPVSEFNFPAPPHETSQAVTALRADGGVKPPIVGDQFRRGEDLPPAMAAAPQSLFPENLTGPRAKDADSSLYIPPLRTDAQFEARRADSVDTSVARIKAAEPQSPPSQISLGELAARLNQGDIQKSPSQPPAPAETLNAKLNENSLPAPKSSLVLAQESLRSTTDVGTAKVIPAPPEQTQYPEILAARNPAQPVPIGSEKALPTASPPALTGHVSNTREVSNEGNSVPGTNRPSSLSSDRIGASDKTVNITDQKSRIDTSLTERSTKVDAAKIESVDARRASIPDGSVSSSSGSDLIKSNRIETQSTDKISKTEKTDVIKPRDDLKTRTEISNQNKREPLIIPGIITSRSSDSGKGNKGTKSDGSGKPDSKNPDTKKVEGGSAIIKNVGTASDAASGRKHIKVDNSDEKGDQRADTKIAASTKNVISGVADRIVDGLATFKDKLIPGPKTNMDSRSEKDELHPELPNHSAQPKANDAGLGIGRDLKPLLPSANSEFVYNGKRPLLDAREDTLSSKSGGLKQALLQIFGNHPDIASDLKANTFPGPKTVPFESTPDQSVDIQPTNLPNADVVAEDLIDTEDGEFDSVNRQQIKDFTVQLGEIANGAVSVPASEFFNNDETTETAEETTSGEDEYDSRYLYYVKEGDTLRSIFDEQLAHESGNEIVFEYFVKTNEQTVRLASVLSADSMSFVLRPGTVLKLPTPRQIAQLKL